MSKKLFTHKCFNRFIHYKNGKGIAEKVEKSSRVSVRQAH